MERKGYRKEIWLAGMMAVIALVILTAATYAWFSSNRTAGTNQVSARTGDENISLYLSSYGGNNFRNSQVADIVQVNATGLTELMPVSTADLTEFVYNPSSEGNLATSFQVVPDENYYYHGRIYLRAEAEGMAADTRMALYLDSDESAGGALASGDTGLLRAARLGLRFAEPGSSYIFYLDDTSSATANTTNTVINGMTLQVGEVLSSQNGTITNVSDPAVALSDYTIEVREDGISRPQQPLLEMEIGREYAVDIYFYLEGCDPDCNDSISLQDVDLHLAFYGIVL